VNENNGNTMYSPRRDMFLKNLCLFYFFEIVSANAVPLDWEVGFERTPPPYFGPLSPLLINPISFPSLT
jgi:hypothetical protein